MNPDCNILNPLQRDGTNQEKRLVRALHPSYVLVDERDTSDLLVYAQQYARLIRFYSVDNNPNGDWKNFIESDISTLVAIIAKADLDQYRAQFNYALSESASNFATNFPNLFAPIIQLVEQAYQWYSQSIKGLKLHTALEKLVNSILDDIILKTVAYAKRADEIGLSIDSEILSPSFLGANPALLANLQADQVTFPSGDFNQEEDQEEAINRLKIEFQNAFESLLSIVNQAPDFLEETLEDYPSHAPHFALFLAFLQLFKIAQKHLNTITKRHLDFYYQEVLQLQLKPETPDEVHIIFQLAKNFDQNLVQKDISLRAGKDDNNTNLFYGTDNELVVNKTKLDEDGLKTVFLDKQYPENTAVIGRDTPFIIQNIYAAPDAASADGLGEDLEEDDKKWLTLGGKTMPLARLGFAISSPIFLLQEGQRKIEITLSFNKELSLNYGQGYDRSNPIAHELRHNIKVYYSGEKDWVLAKLARVDIDIPQNNNQGTIVFTVELDSSMPPFVNHQAEVLKPGLKAHYPTLKFILDNEGLSADFLFDVFGFCSNSNWLTHESKAATQIPAYIQRRILDFLNTPETEEDWAEIAGIEPVDLPIDDNPHTGPGDQVDDYDIGETTARRIIKTRNSPSIGGRFSSIVQVANVQGIGVDKLNDLWYSLCKLESITKIKERARPYDTTTNYSIGDVVIFQGEYYRASIPSTNVAPQHQASSGYWFYLPKSYPYQHLQALDLYEMKLVVEVEGVKNLVLENDVGGINPVKPFHPFGPQPKKNAKFYIGSHEIFQKRLIGSDTAKGLQLSINWGEVPEVSFTNYYSDYISESSKPANEDFTVGFERLKNFSWASFDSGGTLFSDQLDGSPDPANSFSFDSLFTDRKPDLASFNLLTSEVDRGFIRVVLERDFLQGSFAPSLAKYSKTIQDQENPPGPPNEPFTPVFNALELSYRSQETIRFNDISFTDRVERLFHITPFGWNEFYPNELDVIPAESIVSNKIVPQFQVTEPEDEERLEKTDAEGTLYIGLIDLEPEQNVSILFQVAEGSSDPQKNKQEVIWAYLRNNRWVDFDRTQILFDSSNDLLTSGIITFVMPKAMTKKNTILPAGKFWIKASVARETAAISKAIAVMPQAVKSSFRKESGNDLSRLDKPLPAETISKLKQRQAALKKVLQPFSSFNGKLKEQNETPESVTDDARFQKSYNEFYIRVSERLRHKRRAITIWDYERLVLQQFPDIYKVRCLNHTSIARKRDGVDLPASEHDPGFVKLIVLPNLRNKNAVDRLRPMASLNRLDQIKAYIQPLMSDFVTLEVKNPLFERVQVKFDVQFLPGKDKGFYTTRLKEDIVRFLTPWLFDESADLELGGKVHRSVIINFIEETDYVDFVQNFTMNHWIDDDNIRYDVEEAIATTSSSVIVSVPAEKHSINPDIAITC